MNRELKKTGVFLLLLLIGFLFIDFVGFTIINHLGNNLKRGREYNISKSVKTAAPELLFIGASQCQGNYNTEIFETTLGKTAFNAGMGAQHIDYQVVVLNEILKRKQPDIIVWDFDPKLFSEDNSVWLKSELNPYYNYSNDIKLTLEAVDPFMRLKHLIFSYRFNSLPLEFLYYNLGRMDTNEGYVPYSCRKIQGMETVDSSSFKGKGSDTKRKIELMKKTLSDMKSQLIEVYVVVSPMHKEIEYPIWGIQEMKNICENLDVKFYNFSQLDGIYNRSELFRDHIHLCKKGSDIYSRHVAKKLLIN